MTSAPALAAYRVDPSLSDALGHELRRGTEALRLLDSERPRADRDHFPLGEHLAQHGTGEVDELSEGLVEPVLGDRPDGAEQLRPTVAPAHRLALRWICSVPRQDRSCARAAPGDPRHSRQIAQ